MSIMLIFICMAIAILILKSNYNKRIFTLNYQIQWRMSWIVIAQLRQALPTKSIKFMPVEPTYSAPHLAPAVLTCLSGLLLNKQVWWLILLVFQSLQTAPLTLSLNTKEIRYCQPCKHLRNRFLVQAYVLNHLTYSSQMSICKSIDT